MKNSNQTKLVLTSIGLALLTACSTGQTQSTTDGNTSRRQQGERPSATQIISEMDSNKDGVLSKSEVTGPLVNDFSKIDSDGDGYITSSELENAPKPSGRPQGRGQRR